MRLALLQAGGLCGGLLAQLAGAGAVPLLLRLLDAATTAAMTAITMIATMTQISQDGMGTPSRVGRLAVPPVIRHKRHDP